MSEQRRCNACQHVDEYEQSDTRCKGCGQFNYLTSHDPGKTSSATPDGHDSGTETLRENGEIEYAIEWPWGERMTIDERLFVGRIPPVANSLIERLEAEYLGVSRMHAELSIQNDQLGIRDLESMNGTYVNGDRLEPYVRVLIQAGDRLRFGMNLSASIVSRVTDGG